MDFARRELEKYGWRDGKGLGKSEDGMVNALKVKLKSDNSGIGHNESAEFTPWWDQMFNNGAKNINVVVKDGEVRVDIGALLLPAKRRTTTSLTTYGTSFQPAASPTTVRPSSPEFKYVTDDELFLACGGRTAHKGARHGLKMTGKLSRIEKQEKMLLKKMKNVSLEDSGDLAKRYKKLKKHKEVPSGVSGQEVEAKTSSSSGKKKSKKRGKSVSFSGETTVKYYTPDLDNSSESNRDENGDAQILDANSNNVCDEGIEQDIECSGSEQDNTHRSFEEAQLKISDLSKAERKKLKKKRKLEKETASDKFIREIQNELAVPKRSKKRKHILEDQDNGSTTCDYSKLTDEEKPQSNKSKRRREKRREKKVMKSIVESLDNYCKISDND